MGGSSLLAENDYGSNASKNWLSANTGDVDIFIVGTGVDTESQKFMGKGSEGTGYTIVADSDFAIKDVNHGGTDRLIGDPISVPATVRRTRVLKHPRFTKMTLTVLSANTNFQLEVF